MRRFAVVTVLQRQERAFGDLARKYGLAEAMTGTVGIGIPVLALETDRENAVAATIQGSKAAIANGAEVIIFGCTGMLGFAEEVSAELGGARVIDPLPNAINVAHAEAQSERVTDKSVYPAPEREARVGVRCLVRPGRLDERQGQWLKR